MINNEMYERNKGKWDIVFENRNQSILNRR